MRETERMKNPIKVNEQIKPEISFLFFTLFPFLNFCVVFLSLIFQLASTSICEQIHFGHIRQHPDSVIFFLRSI